MVPFLFLAICFLVFTSDFGILKAPSSMQVFVFSIFSRLSHENLMKMDGDKKIKAQSFDFFSVSAAGQVGSSVQHLTGVRDLPTRGPQ